MPHSMAIFIVITVGRIGIMTGTGDIGKVTGIGAIDFILAKPEIWTHGKRIVLAIIKKCKTATPAPTIPSLMKPIKH